MYQDETNNWMKHYDFIILDSICMQIALLIAFLFRKGIVNPFVTKEYYQMAAIIFVMNLLAVFFLESYSAIVERGYYKEFKLTVIHVSATMMGMILYTFITKTTELYSRLIIIMMWELAIILCYCARVKWKNHLRSHVFTTQWEKKSMLIIIDDASAEHFVKRVVQHNFTNTKIVGVVVLNQDKRGQEIHGIPVVACKEDATQYICRHWVDEVMTSYHNNEEELNQIIDDCKEMGVVVHLAIAEKALENGTRRVENINGYTVMTTYLASASYRQMALKRLLDISGGIVGCLLTGILFIFVAPAIYIKSPGPIFFSQWRVGKNGKRFRIYKFRSMYMDAEERKKELMEKNKVKDGMMFKMDNDPRIIKGVGNFIRKTSIDEFPQFLNVLKGDMSLVGTRPPTVDEWEKYKKHHRRRMAIKPGLTGMWQVSGRSNITDFEEVVALDTKYIMEWSMGLDIRILLKTVALLFTGKGSQ